MHRFSQFTIQRCAPCGARALGTGLVGEAPQKSKSFIHATGCGCSSCGGKPITERNLSSAKGAANRGVIFMGPNDVQVKGIPFPELSLDSTSSPVESERQTRKCNHGAILKVSCSPSTKLLSTRVGHGSFHESSSIQCLNWVLPSLLLLCWPVGGGGGGGASFSPCR